MATDEPWAADIRAIYESIHEITPHDEATFRDARYGEDQLREAFADAFLSRSDGGYAFTVNPDDTWIDKNGREWHRADLSEITDPDVIIQPDDRRMKRDEFFEWMAYLGYDPDDFDWNHWREWMDYNGE